MNDVIRYLIDNCFCNFSKINYSKAEICFCMHYYYVCIKFLSLDVLGINENMNKQILQVSYVDPLWLCSIRESDIEAIRILSVETLHTKDGNNFSNAHKPYTYIVSNLLKNVKSQFPTAFSCRIGTYCIYDSCDLCDNVSGYGIEIIINKEYWNSVDLQKEIHKIFSDTILLSIPKFYFSSSNYKDNLGMKILSSNTKIRRLGYLKLLLRMLKTHKNITVSKLYLHYEKYCDQYSAQLYTYDNAKGEIILTKTGSSAKPYIGLAEQLGLIRCTNESCLVGKTGKVFNTLNKLLENSTKNVFELSLFERVFFLEILLKHDYVYLYVIIEYLFLHSRVNFTDFKQHYQESLLEYINTCLVQNANCSSMKIVPIKIIKRRISEWKQTATYIEHIIMPRINWLYDIGLVNMQGMIFNLTEKGEKLYYHLSIWNDLILRKIISPEYFLDNYYMHMVNDIWQLDNKEYKVTDDMFQKYLNESFIAFKTLAPNRVTFSLMCNYVKYMLCFKEKKIIETDMIKSVFLNSVYPGYIYKYQDQYNDGYIQKIK